MRRVAAALVLGSFALAGCSSGVGTTVAVGDKAHGKALFISTCAACHTLAEAKTSGTIGPNLDAAFGSDRAQGFKESTIRQVVADQIRFAGNYGPLGPTSPTMPKNLVRGKDVADVATYVAYVAGEPGHTVQAATATTSTSTTTTGTTGGGANAAGKAAFTANGCVSCHTLSAAGSTGTVGPDLDKLKTYAQKAGQPLMQFIRESIIDPNKYIEKGYPSGVMPQTFGKLPKATLDALVAFLAASAKS